VIVDTSAILAILFEEDDARVYARAIAEADSARISAATLVEAGVVVDVQTKDRGSRQFDAFIRRAGIRIEPVTEEQAQIARQAYSDFGKAGASRNCEVAHRRQTTEGIIP
jgi:ribonuclease VapC